MSEFSYDIKPVSPAAGERQGLIEDEALKLRTA